jgi:TonB family protein
MMLQSLYKVLLGKVACMLLLVSTAGTTGLSQGSSQRPVVLQAVAPVYPAVAASARVSATVMVEVQIDAEGKVTSSRVIDGHKLLDKAAENAARRWVFAASKDEVAITARLTFTFILMPEGARADELAPVFVLPYRVEVRRTIPKVVDSPNIDPPLSRRQKKKRS